MQLGPCDAAYALQGGALAGPQGGWYAFAEGGGRECFREFLSFLRSPKTASVYGGAHCPAAGFEGGAHFGAKLPPHFGRPAGLAGE